MTRGSPLETGRSRMRDSPRPTAARASSAYGVSGATEGFWQQVEGERCANGSAVVEDRSGRPWLTPSDDVFVADRDSGRALISVEQCAYARLVRRRARRPGLDRRRRSTRPRMHRGSNARSAAAKHRRAAADTPPSFDRECVRALSGEPFDEHRLEAAAEREVHRLLGFRTQSLEHRHRHLPLVEARQHGAAQPHEPESGPVDAASRARLDEPDLLERAQHPIDGAPGLPDELPPDRQQSLLPARPARR